MVRASLVPLFLPGADSRRLSRPNRKKEIALGLTDPAHQSARNSNRPGAQNQSITLGLNTRADGREVIQQIVG
jgi:hypothetical protein